MRRIVAALLMAAALAGCAATAPVPIGGARATASALDAGTPIPSLIPAPVPSKACGGFHLVVVNGGSADLAVTLNGTPITTVRAGATADIAQYGAYPTPPMPWDVAVAPARGGAVRLSAHLENDGSDGRRIVIGDSPTTASALTAFVC